MNLKELINTYPDLIIRAGSLSYFLWKVYHKDPFHYYDAFWLFTV